MARSLLMFPIFCPLVVAFRSISYASYTNWALNLHEKRNLTATTHQTNPPSPLPPPTSTLPRTSFKWWLLEKIKTEKNCIQSSIQDHVQLFGKFRSKKAKSIFLIFSRRTSIFKGFCFLGLASCYFFKFFFFFRSCFLKNDRHEIIFLQSRVTWSIGGDAFSDNDTKSERRK